MSRASKVLWGEGLFLTPQHFQCQDAYHEARLFRSMRALHPYGWGVREVEIDRDALDSGMLRVSALSVVFPDGTLHSVPQDAQTPAPLALNTLPGNQSEITVYLAMHPLRELGLNHLDEREAEFTTRYARRCASVADRYTDAAESDIAFLDNRVQLLSQDEPREALLSLALVRIRRTGASAYALDESFVPPCVSIDASPYLVRRVEQLIDSLQAKVSALQETHREVARNVVEFRSSDIASFWLLHTANAAAAALMHLHRHGGLHPERLFHELLRLCGQLITFSKRYTLADLPVYDHDEPGPAFARLEAIVRDLLDTVISARHVMIALDEIRPSFHAGRLDPQRLGQSPALYLSVSADMAAKDLADAVPARFKIGMPEDVDKLVLSATPGVRLTHTPQVPSALPVRPGVCYFLLEPRDPLFERMWQAQSALIYTPEGFDNLRLELIALTS